MDPGHHHGHVFTFRGDGWFNMTKAAQHFGKRLQDFWDNAEAKAYLAERAKLNHANERELIEAVRGRNGGTWAHPKLAVFFARWLDVKFSVWCDSVIEDILKGAAEVTITKPQESAVMALPLEYAATARTLTYMDELSKGGKIPQLKEASRGRYGCIWTTQITGFR